MWTKQATTLGLLLSLAMLLIGPLLLGIDPEEVVVSERNLGPSMAAPFGTDELGRDMWGRIAFGGRRTVLTGACAVALVLLVGVSIGFLAGFARRFDALAVQLIEVQAPLGQVAILLLLAPWFAGLPGGIGILTGLIFWPRIARLVRSETIALVDGDVVIASRLVGSTTGSIIRRNLWPRFSTTVSKELFLTASISAMFEASLGFLQIGSPGSLGRIILESKGSLLTSPSRLVIPIGVLAGVLFGFYLLSRRYEVQTQGGLDEPVEAVFYG